MKRVKEHLKMYGAASLSTAELLAYVLSGGSSRKDWLPIASKLLEKYGERNLRMVTEAELINEGGTQAGAQLLSVICELAIRLSAPYAEERPHIASTVDAVMLLRPLLAHLDHEAFRVLVLNTKKRLVANIELYRGTLNDSVIRPAEVFREAMIRNGSGIMVAHNHPSLDPTPSPEDYQVTRELVEAGNILDIELVDHIIIGDPGYVSMRDQLRW